jgi:hypothetical protein
MQSAGNKAEAKMVVVTNPLLAARLRASSAGDSSSAGGDASLATSPEERRARPARSSPRSLLKKRKEKEKAERDRGRSWEVDDLARELQQHQQHAPHLLHTSGACLGTDGGDTAAVAAVGEVKRSNSVVLKEEIGAGGGTGGSGEVAASRERERTASFLKRLSFEKRKSRDLEVRSKSSSAAGAHHSFLLNIFFANELNWKLMNVEQETGCRLHHLHDRYARDHAQ